MSIINCPNCNTMVDTDRHVELCPRCDHTLWGTNERRYLAKHLRDCAKTLHVERAFAAINDAHDMMEITEEQYWKLYDWIDHDFNVEALRQTEGNE